MTTQRRGARSLVVALSLVLPIRTLAQDAPPATMNVGIDEHLGAQLPLDLQFRDQDGRSVQLRDSVDGKVPTILVLAYYECPMLCGLVLRGTVDAIRKLDWKPGEKFHLVTVSFDPRDEPDNAAKKQLSVVGGVGDPALARDWPFLVGREPEIRTLTQALGFRFNYDPATRQFAHPSAIFVLTPDGRISRYFYGVSYPASDLKLALLDAQIGKSGSAFERILMTCFRYDPATRRYGVYLTGFFRAGSTLLLGVLILGFIRLRRYERAEREA
jgi:protein SCO1/2